MTADVHRDPPRLRGHAATVQELADVLQSALHGVGRPDVDRADVDRPGLLDFSYRAELERLDTAVQRTVRELVDLGAELAAAAAVAATDAAVVEALRRAAGAP